MFSRRRTCVRGPVLSVRLPVRWVRWEQVDELVGAQLLKGLVTKVSDSKVVVRKAASQVSRSASPAYPLLPTIPTLLRPLLTTIFPVPRVLRRLWSRTCKTRGTRTLS